MVAYHTLEKCIWYLEHVVLFLSMWRDSRCLKSEAWVYVPCEDGYTRCVQFQGSVCQLVNWRMFQFFHDASASGLSAPIECLSGQLQKKRSSLLLDCSTGQAPCCSQNSLFFWKKGHSIYIFIFCPMSIFPQSSFFGKMHVLSGGL